MSGNYKMLLLVFILVTMMSACGESEQEKAGKSVSTTGAQEKADDAPAEIEQKAGNLADVAEEEMSEAGDIAEGVTEQVTDTAETVAEEIQEGAKATVAAASPRTHVINAEARVFNPDIIYIQPGDTVRWTNMTSHNTVSVEGLIPEGAEHWRGKLGENLKVTLNVEGIYAYVCEPHIGFGMVGVIVAGQPTNLEAVTSYARDNLEGPYRRIIGKLIKVKVQ